MQKLTTQGHAVLLTVASHVAKDETPVRTRDLYARYKTTTEKIDADTIVERRVRAHLSDLSILGLVTVYERNEGLNAGRYHEYELSVPLDSVLGVLEEESRFDEVVDVVHEQARVNSKIET